VFCLAFYADAFAACLVVCAAKGAKLSLYVLLFCVRAAAFVCREKLQ